MQIFTGNLLLPALNMRSQRISRLIRVWAYIVYSNLGVGVEKRGSVFQMIRRKTENRLRDGSRKYGGSSCFGILKTQAQVNHMTFLCLIFVASKLTRNLIPPCTL
jgi:hypothetical protein